jgi:hypothetical protein
MRTLALLGVASLACSFVSCDVVQSVFEPSWTVEETNGDQGAFHFITNPDDYRIGIPEHVRVERIEKRTIKQSGGATKEEERTRKVRVLLARCESNSICNAAPYDVDSREVVVTPRMMGKTTLYVQAAVDEGEIFKDSITVTVK